MSEPNPAIPIRGMAPPVLDCQVIPPFDVNLDAVRRAFHSAPSCAMGQAWRGTLEDAFQPAVVHAGWRDDSLLVFATLTDIDIFSRAHAHNQRAWELGDAFEIFLRAEGRTPYVEFQVTPNNYHLQLRYSDAMALVRVRELGVMDESLLPGEAFFSTVWVDGPGRRWDVLVSIPARVVTGDDAPMAETRWHFSFSRYDYTRGAAEPVISSTSPHAEANFHRQQEWGLLNFKNITEKEMLWKKP